MGRKDRIANHPIALFMAALLALAHLGHSNGQLAAGPLPPAGWSQPGPGTGQSASPLKSIIELESELNQHPERAKELVPKIEQAIAREVKTAATAFVVPEILPEPGSAVGRCTVRSDEQAGLLADLEYDGDSAGGVTAPAGGVEMIDIFAKVRGTRPRQIPMGEGTILRFLGTVRLPPHESVVFSGEGDISKRLTFLLSPRGLIYMRGRGQVVIGNKQAAKLGYDAAAQDMPKGKRLAEEPRAPSEEVIKDALTALAYDQHAFLCLELKRSDAGTIQVTGKRRVNVVVSEVGSYVEAGSYWPVRASVSCVIGGTLMILGPDFGRFKIYKDEKGNWKAETTRPRQ